MIVYPQLGLDPEADFFLYQRLKNKKIYTFVKGQTLDMIDDWLFRFFKYKKDDKYLYYLNLPKNKHYKDR